MIEKREIHDMEATQVVQIRVPVEPKIHWIVWSEEKENWTKYGPQ